MRPHVLLAATAVALLAGPASAKTLTVSKGGKYPTIQSAVDAASAGDTVEVKPGTYRENVHVPASRAGLTIDGGGKATIDALPAGGLAAGPGIRATANDVTLRGLKIKNGRGNSSLNGDGVHVEGARPTIEDLEVWNCYDAGIRVAAPDAKVRDCEVRASYYGVRVLGDRADVKNVDCTFVEYGVFAGGDDTRVTGCDFEQTGSYGVLIEGDGARIKGCSANAAYAGYKIGGNDGVVNDCSTRSAYHGVKVDGASVLVKKCDFTRLSGEALRLDGDGHRILDNEISDVGSHGIRITGGAATVSGNDVRRTYGAGISVEGGGFVIGDNDVRQSTTGYPGIHVDDANGGLIDSNDVRDCPTALRLGDDCHSIELRENQARDCGTYYSGAYVIDGTGHVLVKNLAEKVNGDGFYVRGAGHTLRQNVAKACGSDGFDIDSGSGHQVLDNVAKKNGGEGVDVSADYTFVRGNVLQKNRIDLANDGTSNTFLENEFETGGPATPGEYE